MDSFCYTCRQAYIELECKKCNSYLCTPCARDHTCACQHCQHKDFRGPMCEVRSLCEKCIPFYDIPALFVIYEANDPKSTEDVINFVRPIFDVPMRTEIITKIRDRPEFLESFSRLIENQSEFKNVLLLTRDCYKIIPKIVSLLRRIDVDIFIGNEKCKHIYKVTYKNFPDTNPIIDELHMYAKNGCILVNQNYLGLTVPDYGIRKYLESAGRKHIFRYKNREITYLSLTFQSINCDAVKYAILALERICVFPFVSRIKDILHHVFHLEVDDSDILNTAQTKLKRCRAKHISGETREAITMNKKLPDPHMDKVVEKISIHYKKKVRHLASAQLDGMYLQTFFLICHSNRSDEDIFKGNYYFLIEGEQCNYCMESKNEPFYRLQNCNHMFHRSCIIESINFDRNERKPPSCPNCRPLTSVEILNIDFLNRKNRNPSPIPAEPIQTNTRGRSPNNQEKKRQNRQKSHRKARKEIQPVSKNLKCIQSNRQQPPPIRESKELSRNTIKCENCLYSPHISGEDILERCSVCNICALFTCPICSERTCINCKPRT